MRQRLILVSAACLLVLWPLWAGCGKKSHDLAPVSGRVTVRGKPMANCNVLFQPAAAPNSGGDAGFGSYAHTDGDGRFALKTVDGKPGAVVGKHVVRINVPDPERAKNDFSPPAPPPTPFPPKAYNGTLMFEVSAGGTDKANFDF
jgi:hypothetical protein